MNIKRIIVGCLAILLSTASCTVDSGSRGHVISEESLKRLKVGSLKNDVTNVLGSPSIDDGNEWLYVSNKYRKKSFSNELANDLQVLKFVFSGNKVVDIAFKHNDSPNYVSIDSDATPAAGKEVGFFDQIIQNIGRFNNQ